MRRKYLVGGAAALLAVAWIGSSLLAEERTGEQPKRVLLINQIDELGRTIFDGILSPFSDEGRRRTPEDPRGRPPRYAKRPSLVRVDAQKRGSPDSTASTSDPKKSGAEAAPPGRSRRWQDSGYTLIRPGEAETALPGRTSPAKSKAQKPPLQDRPSEATASGDQSRSAPATRKLHERLVLLRESAFDLVSESKADENEPEPETKPKRETKTASQPAIRQPAQDGDTEHRPYVGGQTTLGQAKVRAGEAASNEPPSRKPTLAGRAVDRAEVAQEGQSEPASTDESPAAPATGPAKAKDLATTTLASEIAESDAAGSRPGDDVLMANASPALDVKTVGPRRITVGKPASFAVSLSNSGPVPADKVVVTIDLPQWTDVISAEPSAGTTGWAEPDGSSRPFQWVVGRLDAAGREDLILELVPRESRPFDLAVRWDYKPVTSQAAIEVQEPKLEIDLDGPSEILYGAKELYRIELSNYGSGDAENVELSLMPVGASNDRPATHRLGRVEAGTSKAVEVELTARQTGGLTVQVEARGDGGVEARLVEEIVVVKPELELHVEAPKVQYVNALAEYKIRVSNPGTAPAKGMTVAAAIPTGARHESSTPHGILQADSNEVVWKLDRLAPGAEKEFTLSCSLEQPGTRELTVRSTAEGDLAASSQATTIVETMPDLVLEVKDPVGPVPVGAEATYQVVIENRGTQTAMGVDVVAYFSRGIEPTAAEGGRHRIGSGQVVFERIASLGVGEQRSLKVEARAESAGNHICRVEVHCKASGIRLVSEEMTHFYAGQDRPQHAAVEEGGGPTDDIVRTAESQPPAEEAGRTR